MKNKKYIPHVVKDGSFSHVISYDSFGAKCSEPNCIENQFRDQQLKNKNQKNTLKEPIDFVPVSQEQTRKDGISAYLSFTEMDTVRSMTKFPIRYYKNKKGEFVKCRILIKRKNGDIVVQNLTGTMLCLRKNQLFKSHNKHKPENLSTVDQNKEHHNKIHEKEPIELKTIQDIANHVTEENVERLVMDMYAFLQTIITAKNKFPEIRVESMIWTDDGNHVCEEFILNGKKYKTKK